MDKEYADKIITEYMEKIFGFALSKTMNTDKAEELASRITFDVYISLLKSDDINNVNGYIYRVACNVYARFVDEEVKGRRHISLDEVRIPGEHDFTLDFEKDETYIRLRKEVSYFGKIQREIVVMHYFQRLKQYEIAERLNIPLGTVKWHLHDARNQLKNKLEGINNMRERINLGLNPVKLYTGHSGSASPDGKDTSYYLKKLISQNIAYAAYWEAKTITEIAEMLGVSAAFIEDEVAELEEYGFLDKVAGDKYLTNIFISEPTKEAAEDKHEIYKKYAKIICEKYVPLVFDAMKDYKSMNVYTPEDDFNFLMFSAISYACKHKFYLKEGANAHESKYRVKRKDGGDYIACGSVAGDFETSYDWKKYSMPNNMTRGGDVYSIYSWQMGSGSYYDNRKGGWKDNLTSDYEYLYEYITGKITKTPEHADKFKRLFDKGYLVAKGDSEYVNMVIAANCESDFNNVLPEPPEEFKKISEEFDKEIFKIEKPQYPPHMQELCRMWNTNCFAEQNLVAYILDILVNDGTLKPLTDVQKYAVNTIMFCDTLPK